MTEKNVSRRGFLGIAVAAVVAGVVAGVGGYYAGLLSAPPAGAPVTITTTVPGGTSTITQTTTATSTVTTSKTTTSTTGPTKNEIVLGLSTCLTGPLAGWGTDIKFTYETAVADINEKGGIYVKEYGKKLPVRLVIYDDEADPAKSAAQNEKLIKLEGADFLGHTCGAPSVIAGATIAEKYKKIMLCCCCIITGEGGWLERDFTYPVIYFFETADQTAASIAPAAFPAPADQPKTWAIWYEDSFDGRAFWPIWKQNIEKNGWKVVLEEASPIAAKDYSSMIIKTKDIKAEGVVTGPQDVTTGGLLMRQMKELNYSPKYIHIERGAGVAEWAQMLKDDGDYVWSQAFCSPEWPFPYAKELNEKYKAKFGKDTYTVGTMYAIPQTLFGAIEKAGTLRSEDVRAAMIANQWETVNGTVTYNAQGAAFWKGLEAQWQKGTLKIVYPPELATGTQIYPMPTWQQR